MQPQTATPTEPVQEVVVRCPATGERVGAVPVTPRADIEAVAARLRAAQPAWQAMGTQGRNDLEEVGIDFRPNLMTPLPRPLRWSFADEYAGLDYAGLPVE